MLHLHPTSVVFIFVATLIALPTHKYQDKSQATKNTQKHYTYKEGNNKTKLEKVAATRRDMALFPS